MARRMKRSKREFEKYTHADKERRNNPPVSLVTPDTDKDAGRKAYAYDAHLDLQLVWAGKAQHPSFDVPTVSLDVHKRIDPRSIIQVVKKRKATDPHLSLFAAPEENPPIRGAIEFCRPTFMPVLRHSRTPRMALSNAPRIRLNASCRSRMPSTLMPT